ncbi:YpmA family protein [Halalkalibacter alkalisediminis]|uniref:YpmA family protein n=1 Tax=Halalkalibacter alkalisediminis TaxID=935616 RepID=A0ABV6NGL9_9BACI|nr:YpmA family protein [Halalkalibacter alkalisediminis]
MEQKMVVLSTTRVNKTSDLYKIVDSLNRTLKEQDLMFGLALDKQDQDKMVFTIYRT